PAPAEDDLRSIHDLGLGPAADHHEAARWYCSAAEKGEPAAQNAVAYIIASATAGSRDYRKAAEWFAKAADQGYATAQVNLGILYRTGRGVPLDYVEALAWFRRAEANGSPEAAREARELRAIMSNKQLERAKFKVADRASRPITSRNPTEPS